MPDLVIHPTTDKAIRHVLERPPHAILLVGPMGAGKGSLAKHIAAGLLGKDVGNLEKYPYISHIGAVDGKAVPIEAVRELQQLMALKIPSHATGTNRVAIIEDAHLLTTEAQNALLKTLEEPPERTVIILAASSAEALLPTILSRVQSVHVTAPADDYLAAYFQAAGHSNEDVSKALMLSGGLPGLAHALLHDASGHPLFEATSQARALLQMSAYERLALVDPLSKQRALCQNVLFILGQMAHMALQKTSTTTEANQKRWQAILRLSYEAGEALRHNAQPKLVLTDLMLNM